MRRSGVQVQNVPPVLDFLISKGMEENTTAANLEVYLGAARPVTLFLARESPQHTIDQLVNLTLTKPNPNRPTRPAFFETKPTLDGCELNLGTGYLAYGLEAVTLFPLLGERVAPHSLRLGGGRRFDH
jgi:hypothetical protein